MKLVSITDKSLKAMDNKMNNSLLMHRLYTRVLVAMEKDLLYLDPLLTLGKLARIIGTNRTLLSTTINSESEMNFNTWLATFRINHLLESLRHNPDKSIDELYPESGFGSRTSFYRQFRLVTGLSPLEYLRK